MAFFSVLGVSWINFSEQFMLVAFPIFVFLCYSGLELIFSWLGILAVIIFGAKQAPPTPRGSSVIRSRTDPPPLFGHSSRKIMKKKILKMN